MTPNAPLGRFPCWVVLAFTIWWCAGTSALCADVFTNVPEAATDGYQLVYTLPIPNVGNFRNATPVPYSVDNSASTGYFDRIAYYLELDSGTGLEYAYASMDAFTSDRKRIGLPHNLNNPVRWQQIVSNMNVVTNVPSKVTPGTGLNTGNIEFWSTNYNGTNAIGIPNASGSQFDFGDGGAGIGAGHGSFQVHNHDIDGAGPGTTGQTIFGYSDWGGNTPAANDELGIGTNTGTVVTGGGPVVVGGSPDWTFADSAHLYSTKNLQVLVRPAPMPVAPANIVTAAPEASTFTVVYELPVQSAAFNATQYNQDNSPAYADGSFDRLAYYLELDGPSGPQFAYVSMDPFTTDASKTGVPKTDVFQQIVNNMNVISDVAGVVNGTGITTGNIEFWGTNYGGNQTALIPGGTNAFDYDDTKSAGGDYGSMQIHNHGAGAQQTILAYNRWGGNTGELGIGNQPSGNPDWTFSNNSGSYTVKNLWVLAHIAGAVLVSSPGTGQTVDFGDLSGGPLLLSDAVVLQNDGALNSLIDVTGISLTGPDAGLFSVTNFAPTKLQAGFLDQLALDVLFEGISRAGDYSALLTVSTSEGDLTFQLSAAVVPEPATLILALLGLGHGPLGPMAAAQIACGTCEM